MGALNCPYCGAYAEFTLMHNWQQKATFHGHGGDLQMGTWTCRACGGPVVGLPETDQVGGLSPMPGFYEPASVANPTYGDDVPGNVAGDATEAHRCLSVSAWRAAAAMARRAIQAAAFDKGAPDRRLVEQIDWLEEQRMITPLLKDVAHRIRLGGGLGAHPDKDGLRDIGEDDATTLVEFMDNFIEYLYEIPARLKKATEEGESAE